MLRIALWGGGQRHIQPERYVQFLLKFFKNHPKTIDKTVFL
jgi:hypothetical protein